ncbi:Tim10/DDP family zinc finger-domain-containing protein [Naematelia encephala]|uniref:Mitochondrial import inner membrane translocase subunit n=1 Tax=Naematelia encephala TaxID=71784 RepID=A0A1Y2BEY1_9TREE|nr:Tim10/DDP family zinc finger-domain-containing protein [Naematelia encephala]
MKITRHAVISRLPFCSSYTLPPRYSTYIPKMSASQVPQFDAATKKELEEFLEQEQSKAKLQATVHELTNTCWKTCITGSIGAKFSRSEASCLENCVDRFLDSSLFIVRQIEAQKNQLH